VETSRSRVSELTTLHDTARHDVDLLTQRNHTLNDQINDLHAQVRVAMTTNTLTYRVLSTEICSTLTTTSTTGLGNW